MSTTKGDAMPFSDKAEFYVLWAQFHDSGLHSKQELDRLIDLAKVLDPKFAKQLIADYDCYAV